MASPNDLIYIEKFCSNVKGPILEIGCLNSQFKEYFKNKDFTGTNIESGKDVDVVCDLTDKNNILPKNHYDLVICCSVLEHTPTPWIMADVVSDLVKPGGKLYLSSPWVWKYHKYPDDYYRYSFKAIEFLFSKFTWSNYAYSNELKDTLTFVEKDGLFDKGRIEIVKGKKYLPYSLISMLGKKND